MAGNDKHSISIIFSQLIQCMQYLWVGLKGASTIARRFLTLHWENIILVKYYQTVYRPLVVLLYLAGFHLQESLSCLDKCLVEAVSKYHIFVGHPDFRTG
jgi:hypothetical protein